MLSDEEKHEIDEEIANYDHPSAAAVDALKIVQAHRGGWVSDEALHAVAEHLSMTEAELDSVATFYNIIRRQPVGRHVILVCNSVSCLIMGYTDLLSHLKTTLEVDLGGTTTDGRFTLLPNACLGCCDRAPAMIVDRDLHVELDPAEIDSILATYE